MWRSGLARGLTTEALARELGVNVGTLYHWRRQAEDALGVKLPTSMASPSVAGRERAKAVLAATLPPLPDTNCRQSGATADVSEQVNPEPIAPQRVANEPSVPNRGTSEPNLGPVAAPTTTVVPQANIPVPVVALHSNGQPKNRAGRVHLVIPDTQVRKGVPVDHIAWIGQYIVDRKPDVVIHLGDHWDMPSLSMHDQLGSLAMEGARYEDDVQSGNDAMDILVAPMRAAGFQPEMHFTRGNHCDRIERAINRDPRYAGTIGYHHLNAERVGFKVHEFLAVAEVDGVWYSHFMANPLSGRPIGGTIDNRLNRVGHSFTAGHEQSFRYGCRYLANGQEQHGLIAGACYLHDERYKGRQGNHHWRGVVVKHEVRNGVYDIMRVSLDYLCRKYEGVPLRDFLRAKYPQMALSLAA